MLWKTCLNFHFSFFKGPSNDDVGVARDTVFQEIRPGVGFKNRRCRQRKVGGATVERLGYRNPSPVGSSGDL